MRPRTAPPGPQLKLVPSDRRRHGRLRCDDVTCSLGKILDVSASGMRVERRGRRIVGLEMEFNVRLEYGDEAIILPCRVVRVEKVGFRRYSYGLTFLGLDEVMRAKLTRLARDAADRKMYLC